MSNEKQSLCVLIAEAFNKARIETFKFKAIAEISPFPAWISDPEGKILYVNPAYTALTGYGIEDLIKGRGVGLHPEDRDAIQDSWEKYAVDPEAEKYQWRKMGRIIRKDGFPIRVLITGLKVDGNGFVGFTVPASLTPDFAAFDSSLDYFFGFSEDLLAIADKDGYFVKVSKSFSKLGLYNDILNHPWKEFIHPNDLQATLDANQSLNLSEVSKFVARYLNKNTGKYHRIQWNATKYINDFAYCIGRDLGPDN